MSPVRVRFAPSPTGFFHIGSARTALFNWLYARHTGGVFVLRIEDTDKERNSEEFLNVIYNSLRWLGMDWDEGPQKGGAFGPYRQSERGAIYEEYKQKLLASGRAYEKDGAIWFKLLGERHEVFDDHRKKTVTKVKNEAAVINDQIRGRVERVEDEDFVIFRSDGNPVFHFVNVVDDIAMQITHVIRGEDHLSNTSKHVELFKAFGAPLPKFAHIPLILKQNGPGKMSKRDQGALIEEYQTRGYLPEALVNFLSLLGWNPGDNREKMPIAEIIRLFDLPGVNQSNARFDDKKLAHMNMAYLWKAFSLCGAFMIFDLLLLGANLHKFTDGGWLPAAVGLGVLAVMHAWKSGRNEIQEKVYGGAITELELSSIARSKSIVRVPGSAVFMVATPTGTPLALLHHLKANKCLQQTVVLLTISTWEVPLVEDSERLSVEELGEGIWRAVGRYGYMESPDVNNLVTRVAERGVPIKPMSTTYFFNREMIIMGGGARMWNWQKQLYAFLSRNATPVKDYYQILPTQIIEIGLPVQL